MTIKHLYPVIEPSLNLDFANSKKLDPRITFTRGSIGTYVGDDGLIKTAAQNEARFDHDSDGNSLGLLVEESRTNLLLRSEELSVSPWTTSKAIVSTAAGTAPDGLNTANKLAENGAGGSYTFQSISVTSGAVYTQSIFFKAAEITSATIQTFGNTVIPGALTTFDLTTGSVSSLGHPSAVITSYPDGWWRCSIQWTALGTGSGNIGFSLPSDTTIGNGLLLWGAQLEEGSFPTSYIPTEGSTVTRAADVASISGSNFSSWYRQDEGTVFAGFNRNDQQTDTKWIANLYSDADNRFELITGSIARARSVVSGSVVSVGSFSQPSVGKLAASYKASDYATSFNGQTAATSTAISSVISATDLAIASAGYTLNVGNYCISRLTYYPQRLPDATLQALTL